MDELLSGGWNNMERLLEFGPPHLHIGSFAYWFICIAQPLIRAGPLTAVSSTVNSPC